MPAKAVCIVLGCVFLLIGAWGFVTGDRVLIFPVNTTHNIVHLTSGTLAIVCGVLSLRAARLFCLIFGTVYGLVAVLGFAKVEFVVNLLALDENDNDLHLGIAVVFLLAGLLSLPRRLMVASPSPRA